MGRKLVPRERSIQLSVSQDCANDVAVNDQRVVNVADRPFRKIHPPPVNGIDSILPFSRKFHVVFFLTREIEIRNVEREYSSGSWKVSIREFRIWKLIFRIYFIRISMELVSKAKIHFQANILQAFDRW